MLGDSDSSLTAPKTAAHGGSRDGIGGTAAVRGHEPGSATFVGFNSAERERRNDSDLSFSGNRWPRHETLALLKIRSDMDLVFRDASSKAPLWEEVSRKLAEFGYLRTAKKCKEKFENVYKYHKRTRGARSGRHEGKTYRFFDQLEAFESYHPSPPLPLPSSSQTNNTLVVTTIGFPCLPPSSGAPASHPISTVSSDMNVTQAGAAQSFPLGNPTILQSTIQATDPAGPCPSNISANPSCYNSSSPDLASNSTSSSTSSDVEMEGRQRRKRKWRDFFERLLNDVMQKQEEMQKKFLEYIEKRELERIGREESWRMQEMARINREREILAQERSMAAAKDAALMAFLQKLSDNGNLTQLHSVPPEPPPPQQPNQPQQPPSSTHETPLPQSHLLSSQPFAEPQPAEHEVTQTGSSRWPKAEVQALINLRTGLDSKYQENAPKGPLWEEISNSMGELGYSRSAKRCKEKWENINKYFKKVKESNKRRPEESKTCPYFHQLDALYREKSRSCNTFMPLLVGQEQEWHHQILLKHGPEHVMRGPDSDQLQQHLEEDDERDNAFDEEEEAGGYDIVANKTSC